MQGRWVDICCRSGLMCSHPIVHCGLDLLWESQHISWYMQYAHWCCALFYGAYTVNSCGSIGSIAPSHACPNLYYPRYRGEWHGRLIASWGIALISLRSIWSGSDQQCFGSQIYFKMFETVVSVVDIATIWSQIGLIVARSYVESNIANMVDLSYAACAHVWTTCGQSWTAYGRSWKSYQCNQDKPCDSL